MPWDKPSHKSELNGFLSVVIPTVGVSEHLPTVLSSARELLSSSEILVVNQDKGQEQALKNLCRKYKADYAYFHVKSLPLARAYAVEHLKSEYILFMDDDIRLLEIQGVVEFLKEKKPNIVTGVMINEVKSILRLPLKLVFCSGKFTTTPILLPSFVPEYIYRVPNTVQAAQWAPGGLMIVKREVAQRVPFPNCLGVCPYEDVEFSYTVYEKLGGVYIHPGLRFVHLRKRAKAYRLEELNRRVALWKKFFSRSRIARLWFCWALLGKSIEAAIHMEKTYAQAAFKAGVKALLGL